MRAGSDALVQGMPEPPEGYEWRGAAGLFLCCRPQAFRIILGALGGGASAAGGGGEEAAGGPTASERIPPASVLPAVVAALLGRAEGDAVPVPPSGRGAIARIQLEDGSAAIVRRYRRGGLAGKLLPDRFVRWARPLSEIAVAEALRARGAPVPEPLAALFTVGTLLRAMFLVTRELPGREPLSSSLLHAAPSDADRLLAEACSATRMCHDAGLVHRDLNLGNILAAQPVSGSRGGGRQGAVLIDLDRARFRPEGASASERFSNLSRLARSHEKLFGVPGPWGPHPLTRLVEGYARGSPALRAALDALLPRHERAMKIHRLGWKLTGSRS